MCCHMAFYPHHYPREITLVLLNHVNILNPNGVFYNLKYLEPRAIYYKLDYNNRVIFHLIKETISLYKIILHTCYLNKNNLFSYNLAFLFPFFFFLLFLKWIFLHFQVLPILKSPSLGYVEKKFYNFQYASLFNIPYSCILCGRWKQFQFLLMVCTVSLFHMISIVKSLLIYNYRSSALVVCLPSRCKPQVQYLTLWASNKKNQ